MKIIHDKTEARLKEIAGHARGALGFAVLDLTSGERFALNEDTAYPQASAIKIAILMEVFKQAHEGKFKLTDLRLIERKDKTAGSGVLLELGDGTVQLSLCDLCVLMIVLSDNTATNLLLDLIGMENVNRTLGLEDDATSAMKGISRTLYDYFSRLARATPYGAYLEKPK